MREATKNNLVLVAGVALITVMILAALLAPFIAPEDPNAMNLVQRLESPSIHNFFGRDQNGSDLLSRILYGSQVSLLVAFSVVLSGLFIGLLLGSAAGYLGGRTDLIIMRFIDMLYAFPGFLLALALVAVLGPSLRNLILAMTLTSWTGFARLVRAEFLHLKTREFVMGAHAIGASSLRIVVRHIWPNLTGPLLVQMSFSLGGTIIAESGLSFLGLGAPPTTPTWGQMLNAGRQILFEAPHVSIFPGLAILTLVLGFNLLGDGLRDFLDPKKIR